MKRATFAKGFVAMERFHGEMLKEYRYAFYIRIGDDYPHYPVEYDLHYCEGSCRWTGGTTADDIKSPIDRNYSVKFSAYGRITDATYESNLNILIYVVNPDCRYKYLIGYTGDRDSKLDENINLGFHQFAIDNGFDPVAYKNEFINDKPLKTPGFFDDYIKSRYANTIFNKGGHYVRIHTITDKPEITVENRYKSYTFELGKTLRITSGKHKWVKQGLSDYVPLNENEAIYLYLPDTKECVLIGSTKGFTKKEEIWIFEKLYDLGPVKHLILTSDNSPSLYDRIDITEVSNRRKGTPYCGVKMTFIQYNKLKNHTYTIYQEITDYRETMLSVAKLCIENFYDYTIAYAGNMKNPL